MQLAPAASYSRAMRSGSKSGQITPAEGDAFLTSAMRATPPRCGLDNTSKKLRRGPCFFTNAIIVSEVTGAFGSSATSIRFCATIFSRMFKILFLFVADTRHSLGRRTCAQPAIHKRIQVAVHDRLHVGGFHTGAKVLDHAVWLEHIAA